MKSSLLLNVGINEAATELQWFTLFTAAIITHKPYLFLRISNDFWHVCSRSCVPSSNKV